MILWTKEASETGILKTISIAEKHPNKYLASSKFLFNGIYSVLQILVLEDSNIVYGKYYLF